MAAELFRQRRGVVGGVALAFFGVIRLGTKHACGLISHGGHEGFPTH
jgi:hypothetical protein